MTGDALATAKQLEMPQSRQTRTDTQRLIVATERQ